MLRSRARTSIGKVGETSVVGNFCDSGIVVRLLIRDHRDAKKVRSLNIRKDHGPQRNAEGTIVQ